MDAFKRLASEGFLEIIPQVGCRVVVPDPAEIEDFFLIFGAVEGLAADLAATRRTTEELTELRSVAARYDQLGEYTVPDERRRAMRVNDRAAHDVIHRMARSQSVTGVASGMWDRCDFYLASLSQYDASVEMRVETAIAEHAAIIAAIAAGDAETARTQMEAHVVNFGRSAGLYRLPELSLSP
jgi:DNA-binding GntR family transcriptional regulator